MKHTSVMSKNAQGGIGVDGGVGRGNLPPQINVVLAQKSLTCRTYVEISTAAQFAVHSAQFTNVRFWHPPQALTSEYTTELHLQLSASPAAGPK